MNDALQARNTSTHAASLPNPFLSGGYPAYPQPQWAGSLFRVCFESFSRLRLKHQRIERRRIAV